MLPAALAADAKVAAGAKHRAVVGPGDSGKIAVVDAAGVGVGVQSQRSRLIDFELGLVGEAYRHQLTARIDGNGIGHVTPGFDIAFFSEVRRRAI